jgi:heptosyltransferase-3
MTAATAVKKLEKWGRRNFADLLRVLTVRGESIEIVKDPGKILVLRLDNRIGNLVLLTPLLRSLDKRFPEAEISVLTGSRFADILSGQNWHLIRVDKKGQIKHPCKFVKLIKSIRSIEFDVVIDASHPHSFSLSTAVLAALSRIPCRIGAPVAGAPGWYTSVPGKNDWPDRHEHESKAIHALGRVFPDWPEWEPPRLEVAECTARSRVGFHAGGKPGKAFTAEQLRELTGRTAEISPVVIYWGTSEEKFRADSAVRHGVEVAQPIPLESLAGELATLKLFVTPDSGPMHVASAVGTPVIAVFRVNNTERFRPLSPCSVSLTDPTIDRIMESILQSL